MIELDAVTKRHGSVTAVDALSLEAPSSAITVLLGPSGCGKSTTLRMINRLITPSSGTIRLEGRDTAEIDTLSLRRGIGYVIQDAGLFPHWSVAKNIAAVPSLLGWDQPRIAARVAELLQLVDLDADRFAGKRPAQLSGGQAQRVGVARALAADPKLLLMDEPFGALDPLTRRGLQTALRRIQRDTGKTIVLVTHDIEEALLLGDRIAVLRAGRLVQYGTPLELLENPAEAFVRDFLGGTSAGLRRLSLLPAAARARPGQAEGAALPAAASLRDALEAMLAGGQTSVAIADRGIVSLSDLLP